MASAASAPPSPQPITGSLDDAPEPTHSTLTKYSSPTQGVRQTEGSEPSPTPLGAEDIHAELELIDELSFDYGKQTLSPASPDGIVDLGYDFNDVHERYPNIEGTLMRIGSSVMEA